MLIHNSNGSAGRHERESGRNDSFLNSIGGYRLYHNKPEKMTVLKIVAYTLGISGTSWLLYFQVGGWKANILWALAGAFWLVQLARACVKLYFEIKEGQIELAEKRDRYKKDIFT